MADKKQLEASKIDALYSWLSYDLQKMKSELLKELKYSAVQVGSLYQAVQNDKDKSAQAISQEIRYSYKQNQTIYDGLATMLTKEVGERLNSVDEATAVLSETQTSMKETLEALEREVAALENIDVEALSENMKESVAGIIAQIEEMVSDAKYSYLQQQAIYDGLTTLISGEVVTKLDDVQAKVSVWDKIDNTLTEVNAKVAELESVVTERISENVKESLANVIAQVEEVVGDAKYNYLQQQAIYDGLTALISGEVVSKLDDVQAKMSLLDRIENAIAEVNARVAEGIALFEEADYKTVIESVALKTEESVAEHSRQVLEAVEAMSVGENVDYNRIVDEVGDRVLELLGEVGLGEVAPAPVVVEAPQAPVDVKIDYDKIAYGTAEKVVESLPYPEKVNYRRIDESFEKAAEKLNVQANVSEDVIEAAVSKAVEQAMSKVMAALDVDAIATAVAAKIEVPKAEAAEIDYDLLATMVAAKVEVPKAEVAEIDYDLLATMVADKLADSDEQSYDVVLDEMGVDQIAKKVSEKLGQIENVDYARIENIVEEKLTGEPCEEPTYELVIDEEGVQAIAKSVSEELCKNCKPCEEMVSAQAPVEESAEEIVEEVVEEAVVEEAVEVAQETVEEVATEEVVEEVAQGTVEEVVVDEPAEEIVEEVVTEEAVQENVETPVEETPVSEELAVSAEPVLDEMENQLVDAETGLVIRLKRSFTAKMKQSDEKVKEYYSNIKNELTSYKKINSNISWHGDRFNFGRDTVAKVNICGKTLCFYLALDPEDAELKTTVYHQKNVGAQKAYESTPFMVKVKSDAAAKKALRLVGYLAEKLGTAKENEFTPVNYVEEFAYETTKQLFDAGYIKATKEKKVDLDF